MRFEIGKEKEFREWFFNPEREKISDEERIELYKFWIYSGLLHLKNIKKNRNKENLNFSTKMLANLIENQTKFIKECNLDEEYQNYHQESKKIFEALLKEYETSLLKD